MANRKILCRFLSYYRRLKKRRLMQQFCDGLVLFLAYFPQDGKCWAPWRGTHTSRRHYFPSECQTASWYTSQCNFMYSHKKNTGFPEPLFTKFANSKRSCGQLFLGTFAKLRKATVSFVVSACSHGTIRLPLDGFSSNLIFVYFPKICRENLRLIEI